MFGVRKVSGEQLETRGLVRVVFAIKLTHENEERSEPGFVKERLQQRDKFFEGGNSRATVRRWGTETPMRTSPAT